MSRSMCEQCPFVVGDQVKTTTAYTNRNVTLPAGIHGKVVALAVSGMSVYVEFDGVKVMRNGEWYAAVANIEIWRLERVPYADTPVQDR